MAAEVKKTAGSILGRSLDMRSLAEPEVVDAPGQIAVVGGVDPVPQPLEHPGYVVASAALQHFVPSLRQLCSYGRVVRPELARHLAPAHLLEAESGEVLAVEARRSEGVQMDSVEDGLQDVGWAFVGLHRVREDELSAGPENPRDLRQDTLPGPAVEDGILGPDDVVAIRLAGNRLEAAMDHLDLLVQPGVPTEQPVPLVLHLAQVQAVDPASEQSRERSRGASVARAEVEDTRPVDDALHS